MHPFVAIRLYSHRPLNVMGAVTVPAAIYCVGGLFTLPFIVPYMACIYCTLALLGLLSWLFPVE